MSARNFVALPSISSGASSTSEAFRSFHPGCQGSAPRILVAEVADRMRSSQLGRGFAHPAMRALMGRIGAPRHMSSAAATLAAKDRFAARHLGPRESDHAAMLEAVGVDSIDDIVRKTVPSQILLDRALDLGKYSPVRLSSAHSAQTPPPPPPSPPPMPPPSPPPPSPSPTPNPPPPSPPPSPVSPPSPPPPSPPPAVLLLRAVLCYPNCHQHH